MKMKCPECSKAMKREESRTERVEYDGEAVMVEGLSGWFCPACGEAVLDDESARRYGEAGDTLLAHARERRQVEIRRIRKKLKLTQIEASRLVGIGKIAFSRYERGETQAPAPLVKLLRLVDQHPELVSEVGAL
jgi:HTH-type transcriptional regulator/antitoxin MqsA